MKKIISQFIVIAFLLAACGSLQVSDPAQPIETAPGKDFTIVLEANPTTGYHWELVETPDSAIVEFLSREYNADEPAAVGSGGLDVWTFRARAAGETSITLGYYPPSNDPVEPEQTVTFTVIVK
jgi:predicted secreted protein